MTLKMMRRIHQVKKPLEKIRKKDRKRRGRVLLRNHPTQAARKMNMKR